MGSRGTPTRPNCDDAPRLRSVGSQSILQPVSSDARVSERPFVGWLARFHRRAGERLQGFARLAAFAQRKTARFARSSQSNWR
jgi:hypothetical protein